MKSRTCLDCGQPYDCAALRCHACWAAYRYPALTIPTTAPRLRDYPGQPVIAGGYTTPELHQLNALINSLGSWRPARWWRDYPVPRDTP